METRVANFQSPISQQIFPLPEVAFKAPETEEQRARAREALKVWTKFCVDPKDFQSRDLS